MLKESLTLFTNLISRMGFGWGSEPKDETEAAIKAEYYTTYCNLLETYKQALDDCANAYNLGLDAEEAERRLRVAELRYRQYEVEKDLLAKRYYREHYLERDKKIKEMNAALDRDAEAGIPKVVGSMKAILRKESILTNKEKHTLYGLLERHDNGLNTPEEKRTFFKESVQVLQDITGRLKNKEENSANKIDLGR